MASGERVDALRVRAFRVPLDQPEESDGTLTWHATTVVTVEVGAGSVTGIGFTYAARAAAVLVDELLADVVLGRDALDVPGSWSAMVRAIRNLGRPGISSMAIAAVDIALWDLKARLLDVALADLLGRDREAVPVYGSGGFTSYTDDQLAEQLGHWAHEQRIPRVKMKIGAGRGTQEADDLRRVRRAREVVGDDVALYVDANGAYDAKQAIRLGARFLDDGVTWFEEPVSSDHLDGLHEVRAAVDMDVAAGEYGYDVAYFERMCRRGAVDVVQADVSRCAGITEWLRVAAVAAAHGLEISGHCAPSLHVAPAGSVPNLRHVEYFHDHARVDRILFDGVLDPIDGALVAHRDRPGMGLALREADAAPYQEYAPPPHRADPGGPGAG
jgi:L-alanine-DL-glutamate epimerase-like enolase superfamily enzyme